MNQAELGCVSTGMAAHSEPSRPPRPRALAAVAIATLLSLGLAACGDDGGDDVSAGSGDAATTTAGGGGDYGGATGGDAKGSTVVAKDFSLTSVTVAPGAEVTFENEGKATHTMSGDDDSFDSGEVAAGSTASVTAPDEPGAYPFHCEIHSGMTGTLTVEA